MVLLFSIPSGSAYHTRTFTPMQNRSSISMVWNGTDPNSNAGIQRFSHLETHRKSVVDWYYKFDTYR